MIGAGIGFVALVCAYVFMIRPVLHDRPEFKKFYTDADTFWARVGIRTKGYKTVLWSRFLVILGIFLPLLQAAGSINLEGILPPKYAPYVPLILVIIGIVNEKLRRLTDGPVGWERRDDDK